MPPIKPSDVTLKKFSSVFPEEIFTAFNEMIAQAWDGRSSTFREDAVLQLVALTLGVSRQRAIDLGALDVEPAYRAAGWRVTYDRPGYNETYPATFTFTPSAEP